jgi:HD-like signal output (HDOD) protein
MAIQGHLNTISVTEIFSFLQQHRKTGTLCLVSERQERSFVFLDGDLVSATARDPAMRLGGFLVRLGVISKDEIRKLLESSPAAGYLGEVLVEQQFISPAELQAAVRAQMVAILEETLLWPAGAFYFDQKDIPFGLPSGALVQTQSLLLEVSSRADERRKVRQMFPEGNLIFARQTEDESNKLSDHEDAILDLVDGTHTVDHILFKSPHGLFNSALALQSFLNRDIIRQSGVRVQTEQARVTPELCFLPVVPEISGRILMLYNRPELTADDLVQVVEQDPLLTAKLLKALTTHEVELPRSIVRIDHLVDVLGPFQLRSILIPEALRGLNFPPKEGIRQICWEHSYLSARLAKALATHVEYPFPGEAYLAGLLHNLGIYVLMSRDPEKYESLVEELSASVSSLEELEEQHFGIAHTKIGGVYAEKWNFPKLLVQAIKSHHNVGEKSGNPLLHIVSAAAIVAGESGAGIENSIPGDERLDISLKQLNVHRRTVNGLLDELLSSAPRRLPRPPVRPAGLVEAEQCNAQWQ